ncbi:unnamed protein product [Staphylococcus haemolyticus JCSC1435]|uniref:Uncharacterized protein n=1 Tax=Staphylococcus haemolyticus (strain JCSC1435) TaxID=279808 RepID=Q4L723_STAHJ|nr:unnamed protein product [Staphylococcus haemolyticus JCSC1435]
MEGKDAEMNDTLNYHLLGQLSNRNCTVTICDVLPT